MIVRPAPPEHYAWIAERARLVIGPHFNAIEAVTDPGTPDEKIAGMVAYDGETPNSISMHIALDNPAALRSLVKPGFGIAFRQMRKRLVTVLVLSTNVRSRRLVEHLGFREVFRGKDYWARGVDMLLFEMGKDECRYLDRNGPAPVSDNGKREAA